MLSRRAALTTARQDLPWRFAPGSQNRWTPENPNGVVVFGTAENALIEDELIDFVHNRMAPLPSQIFTYGYSSAGGKKLPQAMAKHVNRFFQPRRQVQPEDLVMGNSLTAIHEMLGFCLGDHGDGILAIPPVYGRFELDFGNKMGLKIVYADIQSADVFQDEDRIIEGLKKSLLRAVGEGRVIRALLIVNPNNPLGRCYPRSTLKALMSFCQDHGLHFISDEVYALSVYADGRDERPDEPEFISALNMDVENVIDRDRTHVLYGLSKDFGSAGLRIGCLISTNRLIRKAMLANSRFHCPSGPSIAIATSMLEDQEFTDGLLKLSRERLLVNRTIATTAFRDAGVKWHQGSHAGFFLYIDLSPWFSRRSGIDNLDFCLADRLLKGGVGLHPCEEHSPQPGWFRLIFSIDQKALKEGLRRLAKTLRSIEKEEYKY